LPRRLGELHLRYHTPHIAIVFTTAFSAILGVLFDYRQLVGMSNITVVIQYFFTCLAVPVLRRRQPATKGAWRVPGGWVIPGLGAAGSLALLAGAELEEAVFAALALVVGVGVAVAVHMARRPDRNIRRS
jgi:amino acid transporter